MGRDLSRHLNVAAGERTASRSPSGRVVSVRQLSHQVVDTPLTGIIQFQKEKTRKWLLIRHYWPQIFDKLGSIQREGLLN